MSFELVLAHLVGDYILQSNQMAVNKASSSRWCALHVFIYSIPFLYITGMTMEAIAVISGTHFIIDRFSLAKYIIWFKNRLWEKQDFKNCMMNNGYDPSVPTWLSFFLYVVVDNTLHLGINFYAYHFFLR